MRDIFYPNSVVVIGVSARPDNLGRNIILNLMAYGYQGLVHAVGSAGGVVATRPIYGSVLDVPGPIDLAVILTPAHTVPAILDACGQKGIRRAVVETAGFGEYGEQGRRLEQEVQRVAARHGIRFLGPNCIGVVNLENGLALPFARLRPSGPAGDVSVIAQSGGVGGSVSNLMAREGLRLNKLITVGNMLDIGAEEMLEYLLDDPGTRLIFLYLEGIQDGRRLMDVARRSPKPILALKAGTGRLSHHIAASHAAALANDDRVVDAALRQCGIMRVHDATSLAYGLHALHLPPMRGKNLAIISRSGGHGVVAADACERVGLDLAELPAAFLRQVQEQSRASVIKLTNPLDLGDVFDLDVYAWIVEQTIQQPWVDGVLFLQTSFVETEREQTRELLRRLARLPGRYDKPVAVYLTTEAEELAYLKRTLDLPIFTQVVETVRALKLSHDYHCRHAEVQTRPVPVPLAAAPPAAAGLVGRAQAEGRDLLLHEALALLAHYGLPVLPGVRATTAAEARSAAEQIGCPVALKLISAAHSHKSDVGGVALNLGSPEAAAAAFQEMAGRLPALGGRPGEAGMDGVLVQPMAAPGWELILGGRQDPQFGPVVLVGMGGILVEILDQVALRVAPISRQEALAMIDELQGAPVLRGARGQPPADVEAVADCILRLSQLLVDLPQVREIDVNPLRALAAGQGCQVLDARVSLARPAAQE